MAIEEAITFDDILIKPNKSDIEPHEADTSVSLPHGITLRTPILSAAMDRVTGADMAIAIARGGGLGVLHRNCTVLEEVQMVTTTKKADVPVGSASGPFDVERVSALVEAGTDTIVIDCAHGHNACVVASVEKIRREFPDVLLIAGNIATEEAAWALAPHVDAVKVGVGPGSICTTRVVSGVGVPQVTAIMDVARACKDSGTLVIADGGIKAPGDAAKALAAGAHLVMLGSALAGADEAPGRRFERHGVVYKEYRGMGSRSVLEERQSDDRYLQKNRAILPEGVEAAVAVRGPVADTIAEYTGGIQVAMGYVGARTLNEFRERVRFLRITNAGMHESRPHTVHALG